MPAGAPRVGRGVRGGFGTRAHRRGLPSQGRPRGWKPDRGRRHAGLPSPRPPPPPSSLLPPPARRAAAATARAASGARNGARLAAWPGGGKGAGDSARSSRARGPRNCLRDHPSSRGAAPCWLSGRSPAEPPPAPGSQRQPGKEGGRRRRAAAISRRSPARPRTGPRLAFAPTPGPDGGSALNLKIKLVFLRGRSERGWENRQRWGCRRERCCVMMATWTPAFVLFCSGSAGAPGSPKKPASECKPPQ